MTLEYALEHTCTVGELKAHLTEHFGDDEKIITTWEGACHPILSTEGSRNMYDVQRELLQGEDGTIHDVVTIDCGG